MNADTVKEILVSDFPGLFQAELAKAMADNGVIFQSLSAIRGSCTANSEAIDALKKFQHDITFIDAELDKEFPFRAYERECDQPTLALAWKRLLVDRDYLSNLADQMHDPSVANTLAFYTLLEKRFTSLLTSKRDANSKVENQRAELMLLVYHGIKFMKLKATKAAANINLETSLLQKDFSLEMFVALAKTTSSLAANRPTASPFSPEAANARKREPPASSVGRPLTRVKTELGAPAQHPAQQVSSGKAALVQQCETALSVAAGQVNGPQLQKWIDEQFGKGQDMKEAMGTVMGRVCKNCLLAGRGAQKHRIPDCIKMGNPPVEPCVKCANQGKGTHYHWRQGCPS